MYLEEEVYERLLLVHRACNDEHTAVLGKSATPRYDRAHVRMILVLVDDEVLRAHENAAGAVRAAAGDRHQKVRAVVDRLGPFAHDVIQPQVQLVQRQMFLRLAGRLTRGILQSASQSSTHVHVSSLEKASCWSIRPTFATY